MKIEYSRDAVRYIMRMDAKTKHRVHNAVLAIPDGDIKPLKGLPGVYRIRVGDYRIIYSHMDNETILIESIGPRGDVYKGV